ncbi:MAG: DUF3040 domain-containing protein [Actinomycetota bacterium]
MPLSEDEQRILSEIESQLRETDPVLAEHVGSTTVYKDASRRLRWGVLAFIASLILTIVLLTQHFALGFIGFVGMVAAAVVIESNARRMGRAGINEASQAFRASGIRSYFNEAGDRARERFRRDDDI